MKLIQNIDSFADIEVMGEAATTINRAEDAGYYDELFDAMEKDLKGEATIEQIEDWLTDTSNIVKVAGWDFVNFDSQDEYDREQYLSMKEVTDWDDR